MRMRKRKGNGLSCLPWLVLLLLAACRPQPGSPLGSGGDPTAPAVEAPAATETKLPPVAASPSSLVTATSALPSSSPTPETPTAPACDPSRSYCLYPYLPRLQPPLLRRDLPLPAANYRYGQTQNGLREPHHGLDFPVPFGTPVLAAADGKVLFAGRDDSPRFTPWPNFYGNLVVLEHSLPDMQVPLYTLYGHLSAIDVTEGETVRAGQVIGKVGMSGVAIGSHLHFEVRLGGLSYADTRNPELWLPLPSEQSGLLLGRVQDASNRPLYLTLNLQSYSSNDQALLWSRPLETYSLQERLPVRSEALWGENFVQSDLPPGEYRLSLVRNGSLIERYFPIQAGMITYLVITVP